MGPRLALARRMSRQGARWRESVRLDCRGHEARREHNEYLLILAGAVSVIFGIIVLAAPGAGALGLIWAIGAYSIAFGVLARRSPVAIAEKSSRVN
jgi:hypothetical protein